MIQTSTRAERRRIERNSQSFSQTTASAAKLRHMIQRNIKRAARQAAEGKA